MTKGSRNSKQKKDEQAPWRPSRQRRSGIYFRVEVYDQISLSWIDAPGTFGSVEEASKFIAQELIGREARVMRIDGRKRTIVP